MLRPITTLLLVTALLVCPVFCLGEAAEACVSQDKPSCCDVCGCGSSSDEKAPAAPPEQDTDCICHGAIVGMAKVDGPRIASGPLPPLPVAALSVTICDVDEATRARLRDARDLPTESGRYLCALFCTRLL
ncbi:MAG: hypothetical protein IID44_18065 [Planctomycetes bacterium]|nr:hypothetical protein [Planctomycetota bacterium]